MKNFFISSENDFNILIGDFKESDKDLFFGPLNDNDKFLTFDKDINLPNLFKELGMFQSAGHARKNLANMLKITKEELEKNKFSVPEGFTDIIVGKKNQRITILKIIK